MLHHDISRAEGDKRIKLFLTIKDEILNSPLFNALSPQAKAYFNSSFVSFIFDKNYLDALAQSTGANGLRIYPGATPPSNPGKHGEPTLVIYSCQFTANNGGGTVTNRFASADPDRRDNAQHPGLSPTPFTKDTFDGNLDTGTFENG